MEDIGHKPLYIVVLNALRNEARREGESTRKEGVAAGSGERSEDVAGLVLDRDADVAAQDCIYCVLEEYTTRDWTLPIGKIN